VAENVGARPQSKPLADILLEIKEEFISFVETRIRMFHAEFGETVQSVKGWFPLAMVATIFFGTAYLLLVSALVILVSRAFSNSPFQWLLAFLIVGVLWAIVGGIFAGLARNEFRSRGTFPKKTMEVLQADGLWLKDEMRRPV
jgi:uncharacterized membrane protein YqjE